ncbi:glycoside hydrolase family 3 protein [Immersiella caudata]|uniref:xylan 1,4-beta-xylosidase n=1 Tax=Immersiella caudata TaxID=314043 RepID=A0AA40C3L3_9PEZI|nr:glycoside hydrolase family 3 protein [Immersiella caudata]
MAFSAVLGCVLASLATSVSAGVKYPDCSSGALRTNLVCNTSAPPEARASALVAAMGNSDKLANLVNNAPGFPRLGLSAYQWWNEALHGIAINRGITWGGQFSAATQFPQAITTGATFDDDLIFQIGTVIGTEARAFANAGRAHLDFWTPNVNPFRDPRWGRGHETPGEDVLLTKRWAAAFVKGMQGPGPTHRVIATCKHYAAYDLENSGSTTRFNFNARVSLQELVEYYLPPFQQCARDSKVGSIMCAYNAVNGVPACADPYLIDTILRKHWNWTDDNQYVVSDCDAVYYLGNANGGHRFKSSYNAAIGASLQAGCDNMCWATSGTQPNAASAFSAGAFNQATLDKAMLQSGIVLLHNPSNYLPLSPNSTTSLAMIGFWANAADKMLGGYSGTPPFKHDPVTAARSMGFTVNYATGPLTQSSSSTSAAVTAAERSNTIIFFGGIDNTVEKESQDRSNIAWPAGQVSLLQRLSQLGKPMIVVRMGTHVDDTPILALPNVKAILWAGYPGQDGGTAVMNIITGAVSPAGRLPVTVYPSSFTSQAPFTNMALRPSGTYPGRTYRWYKDAVFPFGHGLHYTNFSAVVGRGFPGSLDIQWLVGGCKATYLDLCPLPLMKVTVLNTGERKSDYVALGFLSGEFGPAPHPIKTLAAYQRVFRVAPGETREVEMAWNFGNLARVDEKGNTVLYPGTYTLVLDQPAIANFTFTLTGTETVLDEWPQPR